MNPIVGTPLASIVPNIPDDYVCESRCVEYESDRQLYFFMVFNLALNLGPPIPHRKQRVRRALFTGTTRINVCRSHRMNTGTNFSKKKRLKRIIWP